MAMIGVDRLGKRSGLCPGVALRHVQEVLAAPGLRIHPDGRGGSHVELIVRRLPHTAKGRLLTAMLTAFGRRVFRADLAKTLALLDGDRRAAASDIHSAEPGSVLRPPALGPGHVGAPRACG